MYRSIPICTRAAIPLIMVAKSWQLRNIHLPPINIPLLWHAAGAPLPPPQPSAPNPDYVQCPYCQRRFQEAAAERHSPFCKEQSSRLDRKASSTKAKESYSKRMQV